MPRDPQATDTDDVKASISQLQADVAALSKSLKDYASTQSAAGVERAKKAASEIRGQAGDAASMVSQEIGNRPMTSVLVAFGTGFLIGKLLERR